MFLATRWALVPAVLAGLLGLATPASAVTPEVRDQGSFFKAEAVRKANNVIADIKRTFNKDLVIETYQTVPGDVEKVRAMDAPTRNRYFREWLAERARTQKVDGIFVLINKDPGNLQVDAGRETSRRHFTDSNQQEMSRLLMRKFEEKKFDDGLMEAVEYVRDTMRSNMRASSSAPAARTTTTANSGGVGGTGWSWGGLILMGILVLGCIWLFVGLIRAFTGGFGGGGYGGYGGGGFMTSMFGGLFGVMAGMWLYNSMFGAGSWGSSAHGSDTGTGASDDGQGFGDGSGGDFGDSGGSSGGDFGGGDWGGGGGDWGGGGGDFGGGGDW